MFSAIWELESQVNNGGFDQFFRNSESLVRGVAPAALRTIGASSCAAIVDGAIQLIAPLPATQDRRCEALDALGDEGQERLETLDSEFLAYPDNLTDLLFEFVRQRPETFGSVPSPQTSNWFVVFAAFGGRVRRARPTLSAARVERWRGGVVAGRVFGFAESVRW